MSTEPANAAILGYVTERSPKDDVWAVYDKNGKYSGRYWYTRYIAIQEAKRISGKARLIKAYRTYKP